ncbi:UDP-2,3-diacylglucosamine pyrophosphatase LpxH [Daejeonella rubra]|uniref:UDP-2,3-diacylglucosamine pyrophosphatase LpxH n=1 Tax=Daejeonella rubra TaxID=990371 RepID=A0A1G9PW07_9SPHI|nr:UDP-2,3-diacylglucosamine diphosphatase [Daejeonella rubra]SDM02958.1 UDP-2,3-diacylglucosamine pyrophosphatase LpxH [Daejeonella rubra]
MNKQKRQVDIIVISDVHLGTYGCRAKELLHYLKSIKPKIVVLNGDIIDIWQFNKSYWPKSHMKVIKHIMNWLSKGVKVYYITGNHDEMLRKFEGFKMGSFHILNKLILDLDNQEKAWIFHGDVFDVTMQHSKWLAKLGAIGYDTLIIINSLANWISERIFKRGKLSFSKKIKNSVKGAIKFINGFEETAADIGISKNYQYVVCGHIHHPEMRRIEQTHGSIMYLNSGDWIENLTALEYHNGQWDLFRFSESERMAMLNGTEEEAEEMDIKQLFSQMVSEFNLRTS